MIELVVICALVGGLVGALVVQETWRPRDVEPHPSCAPCGAFAMYTIAGQPLCEDHARLAVKAGWQAEPIR